MSELFGNYIVGFTTRRLICYRFIYMLRIFTKQTAKRLIKRLDDDLKQTKRYVSL